MLKFKYIILFSLLVCTNYACQSYNVNTPHFDVSILDQQYKVGDSIIFYFEGNPDIITFYSGESGKEYQYRERTFLEGATVELDFVSRVLWGSQPNNLRVKISSDFSGIYDVESVKEATWQDITEYFILDSSAAGTSGKDTPSGTVQLNQFLEDMSKPFYFAYQYVGTPVVNGAMQRTWRFTRFNMISAFDSGSKSQLASLTTAGWIQVDVENPDNKWTLPGTQLQFAPNGTLSASEDWVITKPLYAAKISPDTGVAIKNYSQKKSEFGYVFKESGEYVVTFVASNTTYEGEKTVVKELKISVSD